MDNILLVTATKKSADALVNLLITDGRRPERVIIASSCSEARRRMIENDVDMIIINTPLGDEFGHEFASYASLNSTAGVMMLVKAENAETVTSRVEQDGVFVISKPISRPLFYQAVHMLNASRLRLYELNKENRKLRQRLEDANIINRAKCLLIAEMHMSEPEAHSYLEKRAMNERLSRRDIAEEVIRSF